MSPRIVSLLVLKNMPALRTTAEIQGNGFFAVGEHRGEARDNDDEDEQHGRESRADQDRRIGERVAHVLADLAFVSHLIGAIVQSLTEVADGLAGRRQLIDVVLGSDGATPPRSPPLVKVSPVRRRFSMSAKAVPRTGWPA